MRLASFLLISMLSIGTASADELTAGDLYDFCKSKDRDVYTACKFYVLGVVQGVSLGGGVELDANGRVTKKRQTITCIPDDLLDREMVQQFTTHMDELTTLYPRDASESAAAIVVAIMTRAYPCTR